MGGNGIETDYDKIAEEYFAASRELGRTQYELGRERSPENYNAYVAARDNWRVKEEAWLRSAGLKR